MTKDNHIKKEVSSDVVEGTRKTRDFFKIKYSLPCSEFFHFIAKDVKEKKTNIVDILLDQGIKRPSRTQVVSQLAMTLIGYASDSKNPNPISKIDGRLCYYNGKKWEAIQEDDLKTFIYKASKALGVDKYESIYPDFNSKACAAFRLGLDTKKTPWVKSNINFANGTLELNEENKADVLRGFDPDDGFFWILPYSYDPNAEAPRFKKFLKEVLPMEEDRLNLQEFCGSLFTSLKVEKVAYLYGATAQNGKSTFKDILCAALGAENVTYASLSALCLPEDSTNGNVARANLEGKLLNACGDIDKKIESAGIFKTLASNEALDVRRPYDKDKITLSAYSYARLLFCCNDLPEFKNGGDEGIRRKLLFLEFPNRIMNPDPDLANKIISTELAGVMNWIIEGYHRLVRQNGKFTPNAHADFVNMQFAEASDSVLAYTKDMGLFPAVDSIKNRYPNVQFLRVDKKELYNAPLTQAGFEGYETWCKNSNRHSVGRNKFYKKLIGVLHFQEVHSNSGRAFEMYKVSQDDLENSNQEINFGYGE